MVVQLDVGGRLFTGRGVASDVVEASARAYLAAVNRSVRVTHGGNGGSGSSGEGAEPQVTATSDGGSAE